MPWIYKVITGLSPNNNPSHNIVAALFLDGFTIIVISGSNLKSLVVYNNNRSHIAATFLDVGIG